MANTGTPPVIPIEFQQYNSYLVDPQWARKFSIIWASVLAFFVLRSLPHLLRSMRNGRAYSTLLGVSEDLSGKDYTAIASAMNPAVDQKPRESLRVVEKVQVALGRIGSVFYWTLPGIGLNAGQILILAAYLITVVLCIVLDAPLMSNSNRAGFIALAQFPIVFLFATKNSVLSFLLGPGNGYEKLNFIHRWSGRAMFLGAVLHGSLWIRNHLEYGLEIIGEQKETSGIAALGLLGVIVVTSLKPVRRFCYEVFYIIHMLSFVAFFITICYHTVYASPWIFPPLALYGFDILLRMFRHRFKDAILVPVGNQMTLIHIPYATSGWISGQHVRLRVFFSGRIFESHPVTIFSATPDISCITSLPKGISFGVRVAGDWTRALNTYATEAALELQQVQQQHQLSSPLGNEKEKHPMEVPVQVMIDGPYGGCSVDLGRYETVLLFAGGSGVTFTLGVLDDIVGRCVRLGRKNGERTRRIEFAWCVRSFGSIDWFASALMDIATTAASSSGTTIALDLHISIYVTCLCNPEAVPLIPNCDVTIVRPSMYRVLSDLTAPPPLSSNTKTDPLSLPSSTSEIPSNSDKRASPSTDPEIVVVDCEMNEEGPSSKLPWVEDGGGVAVCASGPKSLTREAANAVARLQISARGAKLGGIGLHTEEFSL